MLLLDTTGACLSAALAAVRPGKLHTQCGGQEKAGGAGPVPCPHRSSFSLRPVPTLMRSPGSMNFASSPTDKTKRLDTVKAALRLLVPRLGEHDSQAAEEEDGGGLRTITFADGKAVDIGDLNPSNLDEKFAAIKWAGGTWLSTSPLRGGQRGSAERAV